MMCVWVIWLCGNWCLVCNWVVLVYMMIYVVVSVSVMGIDRFRSGCSVSGGRNYS